MEQQKYSEGFKQNTIRRLCTPGGPTAMALALEIGVSNSTITRWKQQLLRAPSLSALETAAMSTTSTASTRPLDRSAEDKLRLLMEARGLADEDLGAFLRREGIHQAHLDQWQRDVLNALSAKPSKTKANVADMTAHKRVKELEVELNRKDKALAETAALLVLQKKVQDLWGDKG